MSDRDDLAELTSPTIKCNTIEDTIEDIVIVIVILLSFVFIPLSGRRLRLSLVISFHYVAKYSPRHCAIALLLT